ncbi:MAG: hypothetical protein JWP52_3508 [Rhizobacter sp.]|nr:hypothetical protein [Rhizobacter sp.]
MNIKHLALAALVGLSATAAMAQEATVFHDRFDAPATRAEVQAQLANARTNGTVFQNGEITRTPVETSKSTLSREKVEAEAREVARSSTKPNRARGSYYGS